MQSGDWVGFLAGKSFIAKEITRTGTHIALLDSQYGAKAMSAAGEVIVIDAEIQRVRSELEAQKGNLALKDRLESLLKARAKFFFELQKAAKTKNI